VLDDAPKAVEDHRSIDQVALEQSLGIASRENVEDSLGDVEGSSVGATIATEIDDPDPGFHARAQETGGLLHHVDELSGVQLVVELLHVLYVLLQVDYRASCSVSSMDVHVAQSQLALEGLWRELLYSKVSSPS